MNLYILRHGETDWNEKGILQGSTDIPLSAHGIEMAEWTREGLARDQIVFDKIFSSPYLRARMTAELIVGDSGRRIINAPALREMYFGKYEGHRISDFHTNSDYTIIDRFFHHPENYFREDGAENFEDVFTRIRLFLKESILPLENTCENVLIVSHGAVIRALICLVNEMSLADYWSIRVENCSVNCAIVKNGKITLTDEKRVYYKNDVNDTKRFFV